MHDLPRAPGLLAIAREILLNDLLPLLPPERRLDARLVANCMAIAEREAGADSGSAEAIRRELELLYHGAALTHPAPLSRTAGEGAERREAGEGRAELRQRLARDLRNGAFENSPAREARVRAMLWHLTIAGLRLANPRFLAANGFSRPGGLARRG